MDTLTLYLVIATWALVIVTAIANWKIFREYRRIAATSKTQAEAAIEQAVISRQQFQEVRKQQRRPLIIEEIQYVITPFLQKLDKEIDRYKVDGILGMVLELAPIGEIGNVSFARMKKKSRCTSIIEKIDDHNKLCLKLDAQLNKLRDSIRSLIKDECKQYLGEITISMGHNINVEKYCSQDIVDDIIRKGFLPQKTADWYNTFWKKYGKRLLRVAEEKIVKEKIAEVRKMWDKHISLCRELRKELKNLRNEYFEEYDIPAKEFEIEGIVITSVY